MSLSKFTVIHPFIFAVSPIIFLFSQNVNIFLEVIILPLLLIVTATFLLWILIGFLLKNYIKSGLIVSLGLVLFFSYGHLYDILRENFSRYPIFEMHLILLSVYMVVFIVISTYIIKKERKLNNATKILNVVALSIIILPLIGIGQFFIIDSYSVIESEDELEDSNQIAKLSKFPDIYYIIPDGYAGLKSLQTILNFDNSNFQNFLIEKGFFVAAESYSNYERTMFSITSTLNMNYINYIYDETKSVNVINKELFNLSRDTAVIKNFKSKGYTTYAIESGIKSWDTPTRNMKNIDYRFCYTSNALDSEFFSELIRTTIINPIQAKLFATDYREKVLCGFSELSKTENKSDTPKFVLVHLMIPHRPFVFGPTGEDILPENLKLNDNSVNLETTDLYLGQLEFMNFKMMNVIEKLLDTENPPVIIIQSDHGMRIDNSEDEYIQFLSGFNNFKAYYFPHEGRNMEFETTTPVNSFRILFNLYLDEEYELLEDKIYYKIDEKNYQFRDITEILVKN